MNTAKIHDLLNGRIARFLLTQLTHTAITVIIVAALALGAARVGALNHLAPSAAPSAATSLNTINYQGRLANASGVPISDIVTFQFALYDSSTGGNRLWGPETQPNVPVSNGLFSVRLGSQSPNGIPSAVLSSGDLWLETTVQGETLSPRERLAAVPYAMQAGTVSDGSITTAKIADGAISNTVITHRRGPTAGALTNSTTFTDLPEGGLSIMTTGEHSTLDCILNASAFLYNTPDGWGGVEFRFVLDDSMYGPDANGFRYYFNEKLSHRAFSWRWIFANVTPGAHTIKVQWRSAFSGKDAAVDYNDDFTLSVVELKK